MAANELYYLELDSISLCTYVCLQVTSWTKNFLDKLTVAHLVNNSAFHGK